MPRYAFKDLYVPSFDASGSQATDALPAEQLTMNYTEIKHSYARDEFDFIPSNGVCEAPDLDFKMMEIKPPPKPPSDTENPVDPMSADLAETEADPAPGYEDMFVL